MMVILLLENIVKLAGLVYCLYQLNRDNIVLWRTALFLPIGALFLSYTYWIPQSNLLLTIFSQCLDILLLFYFVKLISDALTYHQVLCVITYSLTYFIMMYILSYLWLDVWNHTIPPLRVPALIAHTICIGCSCILFLIYKKKTLMFDVIPPRNTQIPYLSAVGLTFLICTIILQLLYLDTKQGLLDILFFLTLAQFLLLNHLFLKNCGMRSHLQKVELIDISNQITQKYLLDLDHEQQHLKELRHDIKNHIHTAQYLNTSSEQRAYLDALLKKLEPKEFLCKSGNFYVDACIHMKQEAYPMLHFETRAYVAKDLPMAPQDLCSLLFNLIDNAAEAIINTEHSDILIKMLSENQELYISVTNYSEHKPDFISRKGKHHGHGMTIIQGIVEKYEGNLQYMYEYHKVTARIKLIFEVKQAS